MKMTRFQIHMAGVGIALVLALGGWGVGYIVGKMFRFDYEFVKVDRAIAEIFAENTGDDIHQVGKSTFILCLNNKTNQYVKHQKCVDYWNEQVAKKAGL